MIVTVLWEDQRGAETKGFGPHELLLTCVADDLSMNRESLGGVVQSHPKKGVGNVRAAIVRDILRLTRSGPVFVVVDRDKIRDLWKSADIQPANCMTGISQRFHQDAPGDYDLLFLIDNVESLIEAACLALDIPCPEAKPNPDERDRLLARATWSSQNVRAAIRKRCPSFDRVVKRIANRISQRRRK